MLNRVVGLLASLVTALRMLAAVSGTVMNPDGAPIADARVSLYAFESDSARAARLLSTDPIAKPLATAQTDAKGAFSLASPDAAVVALTVEREGFVPQRRFVEREDEVGAIVLSKSEPDSGFVRAGGKPVANALVVVSYDSFDFHTRTSEEGRYEVPDLSRADRLTVIHPEFAIDDIAFSGRGGSAREVNRQLTAGSKFSGTVVGSDGKTAVSGATILVDRWPLAISGEDGTFTIAHMPARWNSLVATKDDLVGQRTSAKSDAASVIRIERAATLSGRVTNAKTKTALAGVIVRAYQARSGASMAGASETILTDAKGAWSTRIFPGNWTITASHPSHAGDRATIAIATGRSETRDFALDPLARVSGQVVDEARKPVAAAVVVGESEVSGFGPPRPRSGGTVTGPDGRFTLRFEPSTKQSQIVARKRGLPSGKSDLLPLAAGDRRTGVVVTLPAGFEVTGKVLDEQGEPLSGVAVLAREVQQGPRGMMFFGAGGGEDEDEAVHTASDGTFSTRLTEATWDFTFRREGYAPKVVRNQKVSAAEVPAIEVRLAPGVEITGRVLRDGAGIEGVNVVAFSATGSTSTRTEADGSFTLEGLEPGEVNIMARKPEEFVNETRTASAPANNLLIEVRGGGRIRGRVVEKAGGQAVTVFQAGVAQTRAFGGVVRNMPPQLIDFTSDDGSFELQNVPAGATNLVVSAPGFGPARLNVTVEEEKTLDAGEIQLEAGIKLTGRVTGPTGAALANVTIRPIGGLMGGPGITPNLSARTDERGEYVLDGLAAGDETISFSHDDFVGTRKRVTLKDRETKLDAQLGAGLKITGSVVNDAGAPIADAAVEAISSSGTYEAAKTNASGQFEIESASPGRYRIAAHKSGYAQGAVEDFDITTGAPARIVLGAGGTIHGRVLGLTPDEMSRARVDGSGGMRNFLSVRPDGQGNYRIEGAPVGTVQVTASLGGTSGYRNTATKTVDVTAGGSHQIDLEFNSGITVSGRVTRNGMPVSRAMVQFSPTGQHAAGSGQTDENGNYTAPGLEDGAYTVMVRDARDQMYSTQYTVRGGGTFDIAWTTSSIRGSVIDLASNEPLSAVTVSVRPSAADSMQSAFWGARAATTDSTGTFLIDNVTKGAYLLTATRDGYGNETRDVIVGDSSIENLELKLMKNDGVVLRVVDGRDGRAIRASLMAFDGQGRLVHDGRGMFGGSDAMEVRLPLGPGSYSVYVFGMGYAGRNVTVQSPSRPTITLTPGGTIRVRSRHPETRRIRLYDSAGIPMWRYGSIIPFRELLPTPATTSLDNIAPGTYTLQLLGPNDVVEETKQLTVQEGGVTDVEI